MKQRFEIYYICFLDVLGMLGVLDMQSLGVRSVLPEFSSHQDQKGDLWKG